MLVYVSDIDNLPDKVIIFEGETLRLNTIIPKIFYKTSQKLQSQNCEQALNEAIEEERFFLNLKSEDIELLKTLGLLLGKTDIDGQMSELNQFSTLLNAQIKKAEQEENKNKKMYKSLGTIIGLAIVIILL